VLVGGDGIDVACETAALSSSELGAVVPAAKRIGSAAEAAARRGLENTSGPVLRPERRSTGAGARAQLAGCLTGDELTMNRTKLFARDD
jgi:hypothetical protein